MTIHGQIVDLKNGKKCFDQLRHCRGQSFTGCEGVQIPMGTPTHETAVSRARGIADRVLAPLAEQNDKARAVFDRGCQRAHTGWAARVDVAGRGRRESQSLLLILSWNENLDSTANGFPSSSA